MLIILVARSLVAKLSSSGSSWKRNGAAAGAGANRRGRPETFSLEPRIYHNVGGDPRKPICDDDYTYTSKTSTAEERNTCTSWVRYGIFLADLVFIVVGTAIMAMGAWLRTDTRFRDFLSERYKQVVEEAFWEAPTLYAFSYIMIVLGACMIVVGFFGFCGVCSGIKPLMGFHCFFVFLLFFATLSSGIYLFYKRDGLDVELSDALNYMVQHYYQGAGIIQESLDHLQQTFRCCGNSGCSDFRIFRQDPPRTCDIRCDGCHYRIWQALTIGFSAALVVFFFVVLLQVLAVALSLYLILRPTERVRVLYVSENFNPAYQSSPPSQRPPPLTRENVERHNLPVNLMAIRSKYYRRY